jgi:hypothetical protein
MISVDPATSIDIRGIVAQSPFKNEPGACRTLKECMKLSSYAWIGKIDGEVACIYGVVAPTMLSEQAYLWLLTTDLVEDHKFLFVRHSQIVMTELLKLYPKIIGHVDLSARNSVKWLRLLGAKISKPRNGVVTFEIEAH